MAYEILKNIIIDTSDFEDVWDGEGHNEGLEKFEKVCEAAAAETSGVTDFERAFAASVQCDDMWFAIHSFISEYIDGKLDEMKE